MAPITLIAHPRPERPRQATTSDMARAVFTVERTSWPDTPPCPFVIELFTHPDHRRRSHGWGLMTDVLRVGADRGEAVALRVDDANTPATGLYRDLGFGEWSSP